MNGNIQICMKKWFSDGIIESFGDKIICGVDLKSWPFLFIMCGEALFAWEQFNVMKRQRKVLLIKN